MDGKITRRTFLQGFAAAISSSLAIKPTSAEELEKEMGEEKALAEMPSREKVLEIETPIREELDSSPYWRDGGVSWPLPAHHRGYRSWEAPVLHLVYTCRYCGAEYSASRPTGGYCDGCGSREPLIKEVVQNG